MSPESSASPPFSEPASLFRRLAAMVYDGLLLLAVLFVSTAIVLPLTGGEAVGAGNPVFMTYLFLVSFFFFAWFWTHGGQTLGMRAWKIRVQRLDGGPISWSQALLRYMVGLISWHRWDWVISGCCSTRTS